MVKKNDIRIRDTGGDADVWSKSLRPYYKTPFHIISNGTDENNQSDSMMYDPNSMPSQRETLDSDTSSDMEETHEKKKARLDKDGNCSTDTILSDDLEDSEDDFDGLE